MRTDVDGVPIAVDHGRRQLSVEAVLDRWRTDDRWWTPEPVVRAYYALLLEDGRAPTVFCDEITGSWWEQRYG